MGDLLKGVLNVFTGGLGGSVVEVVQTFLGNKRREQRLNTELRSQVVAEEARRKRALIKASRGPLRFMAFGLWMMPLAAPALPGITIDDTTLYVDRIINGMPGWYVNIGLMMFAFIWGGAEWKGLIAERDEERLTEKEIERDTERARSRTEPPNRVDPVPSRGPM